MTEELHRGKNGLTTKSRSYQGMIPDRVCLSVFENRHDAPTPEDRQFRRAGCASSGLGSLVGVWDLPGSRIRPADRPDGSRDRIGMVHSRPRLTVVRRAGSGGQQPTCSPRRDRQCHSSLTGTLIPANRFMLKRVKNWSLRRPAASRIDNSPASGTEPLTANPSPDENTPALAGNLYPTFQTPRVMARSGRGIGLMWSVFID